LHGKYRIVSVDNDVVSITDNALPFPNLPYDFKTSNVDDLNNNPPEIFNQNIPPIVHITSPKNSRFILKTKEPVEESLSSGYIRTLVFSNQLPNNLNLSLYIDDKLQQTEFEFIGNNKLERRSDDVININSRDEQNQVINEKHTIEFNTPPLWIAKWDNSMYNDGKSHKLQVVAIDNNNLKGENTISFRLDGKQDGLGIPSRGIILLKSVFVKTLPILFGIIYILYELMVLLSRLYAIKNIIPKHSDLPFLPNKYIGDIISNDTRNLQSSFFKRTFVLPFIEAFTINGIFYPLQILIICLVVLPSRIGIMSRTSENTSKLFGEFLYGSYGSGQWANTFDQYGIFALLFLLIPFVDTIIIAYLNHRQKRNHIITLIILSIIFLFQFLLSFV